MRNEPVATPNMEASPFEEESCAWSHAVSPPSPPSLMRPECPRAPQNRWTTCLQIAQPVAILCSSERAQQVPEGGGGVDTPGRTQRVLPLTGSITFSVSAAQLLHPIRRILKD